MHLFTIINSGGLDFLIEKVSEADVFRYIFMSVSVLVFGYVVVWGQTRSLYKANRLLKEKEEALRQIGAQSEELAFKNKNITDSLTYAKRIQEALIPSPVYFARHFSESFILFKPRDIVSGDFYHVVENGTRTYVVVADCTGHGVPGALMSMIGIQTVDRIIKGKDDISPSEVLDKLNLEVESTFHREDEYSRTIKDGMDISICCIDKTKGVAEFSGSFLPLYLIRDGKLTEYKGDKQFIGKKVEGQTYTNHIISLEKDDVIYMMSDGYADQFGGTENKKFMNRRLRYLLVTIHTYSLKDQGEILEENITTWMGINQQIDDILVIGFRP
ncbi:MAG: SpoIIE family protein phosphatase [Bacteroidales bacterium]|nr:SpoIIE family protein phosphatase [Bacteroidales bacterium]